MAIEDDDLEENGEQDELAAYEKKLRLNRILLMVSGFITLLVVAVMITGLTVLYLRVDAMTPSTEGEDGAEALLVEQRFSDLESRLQALSDFRKGELRKVAEFTRQLEQVYEDCSADKTTPFKQLLIDRERDFQAFLKTMKSGTDNLSGMAKGSKAWVNQHNRELDALIEESIARQSVLKRSLEP